jgi:hypothetical protein
LNESKVNRAWLLRAPVTGASLARLAALVGYDVALIDDRAEFVARELFLGKSEEAIELIVASS